MKFSLRSLMIVVTLACVVLGGRVEYLRRWAVFHEQMAVEPVGKLSVSPTKQELIREEATYAKRIRHKKVAANYRAGFFRPWLFVNESVDVSDDEVIEEIWFGRSP